MQNATDDLRERQLEEEAALIKKREKSFSRNLEKWYDNFISNFRSWQSLILWTKRFVGLVITLIGLTITFFIVNFAGSGALWLVDNWVWSTFYSMLITIGIISLLICLAVAMVFWVDHIKENGLRLWYARMIYYPIYYVIYIPGKFFFYDFLFLAVGVNVVYFAISSARLIWNGLLGFLGIFGEYFGASYSDYCPGIEWSKENDETGTLIFDPEPINTDNVPNSDTLPKE